MGIIGNVKDFWNKAVDTVKNIATVPSVLNRSTDTLNQQINNGTLDTPSAQTGFSANLGFTPRSSFDIPLRTAAQDDEIVAPIPASVDAPLNEVITNKVGQWGKKALNDLGEVAEDWFYKDEITKLRNQDKSIKPSIFALGYNPETGVVQYLTTTAENEDRLLDAYNLLDYKRRNAQTLAEEQQAIDDFYNESKDLFGVGQKRNIADSFTPEELNTLSQNVLIDKNTGEPITTYGGYTPTKAEFFDYVSMLLDNYQKSNTLTEKWGVDGMGRTVLNLSGTNEELSNIQSNLYDIAERGVTNRIDTEIATKDGNKAFQAIQRYRDAEKDQFDRILNFCAPVFAYEQEALAKAPSERNEGDWYIIDTANRTRKALEKYAGNLNNWMNLILDEGVDENGQIVDALDVFKNGQTLNDVLRDGLQDIMGLDVRMEKHASPLDMFQALTNDGIYRYRMANTGNIFKKGWMGYERFFEPAGDWEAEVGQYFGSWPIHVVDVFVKGRPQSVKYLDMDFSIGKLIETDDSAGRRLVKKFALGLWEYAPEGIGTIAPDMFLILAMQAGGANKALRTIGSFGEGYKPTVFPRTYNNVSRWLKAVRGIEDTRKASSKVGGISNGLQKIKAIGTERANIDSRRKRFRNIADRTLTQLALGQTMDAKMSVFDTEPYSDTSFYLSVFGSILGDILPEAKDLYGAWRNSIRGGRSALRTAGVWDLVNFMSESQENKELIMAAMRKSRPNFTEQELRAYVDTFAEVSDAAKILYNNLNADQQAAAGSRTKDLMYNYIKQAYGANFANTNVGRAIRQIVANRNTNPADIIKYIGRIPGEVQFGPYSSIIRLKNGTLAGVAAKDGGWYDISLDILDGGFDRGVVNGFSENDIRKISGIKGYGDVYKDKDKLFRKVDDKYYLSDEGLDYFNLSKNSMTLEALGIDIADAENTREILKERMKDLPQKNITADTIEYLADTGGYDEIVNKVKEILC